MRPNRARTQRDAGNRSRARQTARVVALATLAGVLFVTWPQSLGGRIAYIKVSGHSMEPTMHFGDLVVIRAQSNYHVGETIAYRVPPGEVGAGVTVIHRIVGGNSHTGYLTRGDNNHYNDPWRPHLTNIVGARWTLIPGAANAFSQLRGPLPLAAFAALLTMLGAYEILKPRRRQPSTNTPPVTNDEPVTVSNDQRPLPPRAERPLVYASVRSK
jgi:signal peptidase